MQKASFAHSRRRHRISLVAVTELKSQLLFEAAVDALCLKSERMSTDGMTETLRYLSFYAESVAALDLTEHWTHCSVRCINSIRWNCDALCLKSERMSTDEMTETLRYLSFYAESVAALDLTEHCVVLAFLTQLGSDGTATLFDAFCIKTEISQRFCHPIGGHSFTF